MTNPDKFHPRLQIVTADNGEIIDLAAKLWADPALRQIFERVGYDADMSDAEERRVLDKITEITGINALQNPDQRHLLLAPCLLRRLASGMISDLNDPGAHEFLNEHKPMKYVGNGEKSALLTRQQVKDYATWLMADPEICLIMKSRRSDEWLSAEQKTFIHMRREKYRRKFGLINKRDGSFGAGFHLA